ncbi:MAG: flagellar hook-length control protein FliK [Gammaproteobacteria bacterium]
MNPLPLNALSSLQLRSVSLPASVRGWAIGQLLSATVMDVDSARETATLRIGNELVQARIAGAIAPGEQLSLRVTSTGEQPVLERIEARAATAPQPAESATAQEEVAPAALRARLPQTVPLTDLISTIAQHTTDTEGESATAIAPRIQATLQSVIAALPSQKELSDPRLLKQAMQGSGLFLESLLAKSDPEELKNLLPKDFKAQLLRLASELPQQRVAAQQSDTTPTRVTATLVSSEMAARDVPPAVQRPVAMTAQIASTMADSVEVSGRATPRLSEQVRGGVAQIEVNQLRHLSDVASGNPLWRIDLPVRDPNGEARIIHFEIEDETPAHGDGQATRQWTMRVNLDVEPLGPMHAKVTLVGERVHTCIWAEQAQTLELARAHVDWLQSRFEEAGLDASDVQCFAGRPVSKPAETAVSGLVDVHA